MEERKLNEIRLKARAKINLCLDVLRRRPDGYHDLRMVMQTVNLCDEITLRTVDVREPGQTDGAAAFRQSERFGMAEAEQTDGTAGETDIRIRVIGGAGLVPADSGNLAYRAAQMLMEEFEIRQGLEITLKKQIPAAAGLAGGSADAAAVLTGVNQMFDLKLDEQALMRRGVKIGADVPYCILRGTALAEGIGDRLTRLPQAPEAYVVLAKPPVEVSTGYVYANLRLDEGCGHPDVDGQVRAIREGDLYRMAKTMGNMLEAVTIPAFPVVGEIKARMMRCGAVNAMMSGSGPTVFGLFEDRVKAENACEELADRMQLKEVFLTTFYQRLETAGDAGK
ncbi:MAG: 4-(cytidine 5'-diphospho)-2-C-methyl-D-erythritol kinase [Lachnospiraceae bacterium]|nr:4-(cytidine 5'-diphospho)-2-C-methyl-D-erythritol kinase [Lachnospiraceae bacterium]